MVRARHYLDAISRKGRLFYSLTLDVTRTPRSVAVSLKTSRAHRVSSKSIPYLPQALTLYTKDLDGSVKAVIAAKAGGLDLTVLPINQYKGPADVEQVRSRSDSSSGSAENYSKCIKISSKTHPLSLTRLSPAAPHLDRRRRV